MSIGLNHAYVVLDQATYATITESQPIQDFAFCEIQQNEAEDQNRWEGLTLWGKTTYFEFFYPQERYSHVGVSGIGLGVESPAELQDIYQDLKGRQPNIYKDKISRNGRPWFEFIRLDGIAEGNHAFWVMAYCPEAFEEKDSLDTSRQRYNANRFDTQKKFLNIKEISIALSPKNQEHLAEFYRNLGLIYSPSDKSFQTCEGTRITLSDEASYQSGIYQILVSLTRPMETPQTHKIGSSDLSLIGSRGKWRFSKL